MSASTDPAGKSFDVAIVGGALAGAATATLLLRARPQLRVAIIEKSEKFGRRVGEATVELSAFFLSRVLGLTRHLNESHLVKQGLRFWFANDASRALDQCSEIGGRYLARVPSYQVDRAVLDQEILGRAINLGAVLFRPASVQRIDLHAGKMQRVHVRIGGQELALTARWVVDASGLAALLARQQGWLEPNTLHPTTAVWSRWRGVKDMDDWEMVRRFPEWSRACYGIRNTATNHFMGDGWWAWCIPLKGGDVSVGVVFDQRFVQWPEGGSLGERLKDFLCQHPVGRELLSDATWTEGDVHWRKNLPYCSKVFAGDGFVLVGDAAGFLDPFYSPGMDWISFTTFRAAELILAQQEGRAIEGMIARQNHHFHRSYWRWFEALYRDKYVYMGDFDLMRMAFLLDLGLYYLGVAWPAYRLGTPALLSPAFATDRATPAFLLMQMYNRRLAQIARARRERGCFGRSNANQRFLFAGYTFSLWSLKPLFKALFGWARLEMQEGWRTWFANPSRRAKGQGTEANNSAVPHRPRAAVQVVR
jgi:flavin-dependent dehydrogenase